MRAAAKKALAKVYDIAMFSKEGWKRVHDACKHLQDSPSLQTELALADGFIAYQEIWYDDNGLEGDWEFDEDVNIEKMLLDRFVDYLQRD